MTEFDPDWSPSPAIASRLGIPDEMFTAVWPLRQRDRMTGVIDFSGVLREACVRAGLESDASTANLIDTVYAERLATKSRPFEVVDGAVLEALAQLRVDGLRLGVISNCSAEEVTAWPSSSLSPLFDDVVFSYQVGVAKPDPDIYRLACQRLGSTTGRTAFVGDGGSDELAGAAAAGLITYCGRWFLDRWPAERRSRESQRRRGFPMLNTADDLVAAFVG